MTHRSSYAAGFIIATLAVASTARAQHQSPIDAGGWIIGGSAGLSWSHDGGTGVGSSMSAQLAPTALRFVQRGLAVGGTVIVGYNTFNNGHTYSLGLGPSVRY